MKAKGADASVEEPKHYDNEGLQYYSRLITINVTCIYSYTVQLYLRSHNLFPNYAVVHVKHVNTFA